MNNILLNDQKSKRKGQAALEFMTTYGWAILVVMVSIAALSYFGFTNPQKLLPDRCVFGNGMICQDSRITSTAVNISLVNGIGRSVYNVVASPDGFSAVCRVNGALTPVVVNGDAAMNVECRLTSVLNVGEKKKFKIFLNYSKTPLGYMQVSLGEVYGTVQ